MLSIKKRLAGAAMAGAFTVAGVAGFMAPASAASLPSARSGLAGVATATLPNVNIKGSPQHWSPTSLSVTPKPYTTCTPSKEVWTITNTTSKPAVITYRIGSGPKSPLGTLAPKSKAGICSKGPAGTKERFYLANSKSVLHLTLK